MAGYTRRTRQKFNSYTRFGMKIGDRVKIPGKPSKGTFRGLSGKVKEIAGQLVTMELDKPLAGHFTEIVWHADNLIVIHPQKQ